MVRDGLADETGAKAIEQRGIDFAPTDEFIQSLKAAGANDAFLAALRAAKHPEPANAKKPINQIQVFALLAGQVPSHRVAMLVQERGIDFEPDAEYLREVRLAGGDDEVVGALKGARVTKPGNVDPALRARQAEIERHVAAAAEFIRSGHYADAESEYRAALGLDPQNADLHVSLGVALAIKGERHGAVRQFLQALRLDPGNERAHVGLRIALGEEGDWDGEVAEEREALRLNPNDESAHHGLGVALDKKGDQHSALDEYREAYELDSESPTFKEAYENCLSRVDAAERLEKLQHWLGTWVFAGPVKLSGGCGGKKFLTPDVQIADYSFKVLKVSPSGEVVAQLEHPYPADEAAKGIIKPGWSGTATENTLVLTMDPIPPGTALLGTQVELKSAAGRLEARREGGHYSVDFFYTHTWITPNGRRCSDFFDEKRFLGQMAHP